MTTTMKIWALLGPCTALGLSSGACSGNGGSADEGAGTTQIASTSGQSEGDATTTVTSATTQSESTTTSETGASSSTTGMVSPEPVALHTIIYTAGPAWDPKLPPERQDLAAHFGYIEGLFGEGVLLANGPFLDDGRGFYLHLAEQVTDIDAIVDNDPAVRSGVLALDELAGWTLLLSQMDEDVGDDAFFVLNYDAGPMWEPDVPLARQPGIAGHLGYVDEAFVAGDLLAGGPIDDSHGRYIVALPDAAAAQAWVGADPAVLDGTFVVEVKPWLPLLRQSVSDALGR